jgi:hypothetical protein
VLHLAPHKMITIQNQTTLKNYPSRESINSLFQKSLSGKLEIKDIETYERQKFKEGISQNGR